MNRYDHHAKKLGFPIEDLETIRDWKKASESIIDLNRCLNVANRLEIWDGFKEHLSNEEIDKTWEKFKKELIDNLELKRSVYANDRNKLDTRYNSIGRKLLLKINRIRIKNKITNKIKNTLINDYYDLYEWDCNQY